MSGHRLIGIVHLWIENVRITGYGARGNEYIPAGTVGDMEVIETSVDACVILARFYPGGRKSGGGYGIVMWPHWEFVLPNEAPAVTNLKSSGGPNDG